MSDPEDSEKNFLQRWSRRKSAAERRAPEGTKPPFRERTNADTSTSSRAAAKSETDLSAFDPATLPPIELITAASDIRAFLAPGVPEALTRAALRRVWVTDPAIRDFIGLAENQWDFTKPDSVPGFGSLEFTPELRRMVAGLFDERTRTGRAHCRKVWGAGTARNSFGTGGERCRRRAITCTHRPHYAPRTPAQIRFEVIPQDSKMLQCKKILARPVEIHCRPIVSMAGRYPNNSYAPIALGY